MSYQVKRNCCIKNCNNSGYQLRKWREGFCEIHNCNFGTSRCICDAPFQLFPFPTEVKKPHDRKIWIKNVNRVGKNNKVWQPNDDSRVCSIHFVDREPTDRNPYPTLQLGYDCANLSLQKPRLPPLDRSNLLPSPHVKKRKRVESETETLDLSHDHDYISSCEGCQDKSSEINHLKLQIKNLQTALSKKNSEQNHNLVKTTMDNVLKSDKSVKFYTGIPTIDAFNTIYKVLEPKIEKVRYWRGTKYAVSHILQYKKIKSKGRKSKLTVKQEMVLTLMKLRLGLTNMDLADRFNISESFVSKVFCTWIKTISSFFGSLVYNPQKEVTRANLPPSFQKSPYNNVRHIIDCTEVFIEKPQSLKAQSLTWSDYKHHHTAKLLVSITPTGMINFVSKCWGGRTSDKYITNHSGFLDIIEPYDTVMADRGFQIQNEITLQQAYLLIPPGRRGASQMSSSDVTKTKEIANRRIYVEQAIRRMKTFRILKYELPILMAQHLDFIVPTVAGICNLYPPLPKYKPKGSD